MEAMLRDWVNWSWLSGDHIVEQHVHNLDVITWFTGSYPVKAMGMGGRMRRPTGDQYDFFAVDYTMDNGIHVQSTCRQIDGCANNISEFLLGTKGSTNCRNRIFDRTGKVIWQYQETATTEVKEGEAKGAVAIEKEDLKSRMSAYDQEHIDLVTAIRTNQPINEAENTAKSTLMAILGRASAYTGADITWDEIFQSPLRLGPKEYSLGDYKLPATPPVAGRDRLT
jgi:predicted dehydrogenase